MRKLLPPAGNQQKLIYKICNLLIPLFLILGQTTYAQTNVQVQGTIIDSTGEPLPGVNVVIKGTLTGTVSDLYGKYNLSAPSDATLVFSFVGFTNQEIPINNQTEINLTLADDTSDLDEFVVVGYGLQRKSDLTGSISSIKSKEINRLPVSNVTQALQGRVSGVQVTSLSGAPGAGTTIRIRGVGTLNNSNPLFVVDGMLLDDIDFLNPNDVESMEVLKDASATAIYGSRGANGVVIVSTKQGSFNTKGRISVDTYTGIQQVTDRIDLVNGIGVNLSHIVLVIRHFVLIFSFSGMILF
jgi:TonB-dependent SusC/RagA subfamily outer membrane receptor